MSEDTEKNIFNGDINQALNEIFSLKESNVIYAIFISLFFVIGSLHAFDWNKNYYDDAVDATTPEDWTIEFDIEILLSLIHI